MTYSATSMKQTYSHISKWNKMYVAFVQVVIGSDFYYSSLHFENGHMDIIIA